MDAVDRRNLLISLNANNQLSRDAVCRLSASADQWLATPRARIAEAARRQAVKPNHLRVALEVARAPRTAARRELRSAERHRASIITRADDAYPTALTDLELPPPVLYVRGRLPPYAISMTRS